MKIKLKDNTLELINSSINKTAFLEKELVVIFKYPSEVNTLKFAKKLSLSALTHTETLSYSAAG